MLECRLAAYVETGRTDIDCTTSEAIHAYSQKVVCLNSATAAEEMNLRILGVGPGDEVIVPATRTLRVQVRPFIAGQK